MNKQKILTISDIHGRPYWKDLIKDEYDLIIFLGDYVDAYEFENTQVADNLLDIIQYKKDNSDKVILLWGNHDVQYLFQYSTHGCSGFRSGMYVQLHDIFNENKSLFQVAYQINDLIWTHAGISTKWYEEFLRICPEDFTGSLSDKLNSIAQSSKEWIISQCGYERGGLRGNNGGPLWADQQETRWGALRDYHQIVGHTPQPKIKTFKVDDNTTITYCDVLQHTREGYILEI